MNRIKKSFNTALGLLFALCVCLGSFFIPETVPIYKTAYAADNVFEIPGLSNENLFGYWPMNGVSPGDTFADVSGRGHHFGIFGGGGAIPVGPAEGLQNVTGAYRTDLGQCLVYGGYGAGSYFRSDCTGDGVTKKTDGDLSFTVSMNIRINAWPGLAFTNDSARSEVLGTGGVLANGNGRVSMAIVDTASLTAGGFGHDPGRTQAWPFFALDGGEYVFSSTGLRGREGLWMNIIFLCQSRMGSGGYIQLYVNGVLQQQPAVIGGGDRVSLGGSRNLTHLFGGPDVPINLGGHYYNGTVTTPFCGDINNLMIFSRAIKPLEIKHIVDYFSLNDGFVMPVEKIRPDPPDPPEPSLVTFWVNNGFADISVAAETVEYGGAVSAGTLAVAAQEAIDNKPDGKEFMYWNTPTNYVTGPLNVYPVYGAPGELGRPVAAPPNKLSPSSAETAAVNSGGAGGDKTKSGIAAVIACIAAAAGGVYFLMKRRKAA